MGRLTRSDPELLERRWWQVDVRRRIQAQASDVWVVVSDLDSLTDWYRPVSRFDLQRGDGHVGSIFDEHESWWKTTVELTDVSPGASLDLATRSINFPGLLRGLHRRIELVPAGDSTDVIITGAFRFGPLGWLLVPYTYPQMRVALWFEYRSALSGLAAKVEA